MTRLIAAAVVLVCLLLGAFWLPAFSQTPKAGDESKELLKRIQALVQKSAEKDQELHKLKEQHAKELKSNYSPEALIPAVISFVPEHAVD